MDNPNVEIELSFGHNIYEPKVDSILLLEGVIQCSDVQRYIVSRDTSLLKYVETHKLYYKDGFLIKAEEYIDGDKYLRTYKVTQDSISIIENLDDLKDNPILQQMLSIVAPKNNAFSRDYYWIRKTGGIHWFPMKKAAQMFLDPQVKSEYDNMISGIQKGLIARTQDSSHAQKDYYINTLGDTVRTHTLTVAPDGGFIIEEKIKTYTSYTNITYYDLHGRMTKRRRYFDVQQEDGQHFEYTFLPNTNLWEIGILKLSKGGCRIVDREVFTTK